MRLSQKDGQFSASVYFQVSNAIVITSSPKYFPSGRRPNLDLVVIAVNIACSRFLARSINCNLELLGLVGLLHDL